MIYVACTLLVCSNVSFETLDLDGSDFPSQLDPRSGYAIEPEAGNDAERLHRAEGAALGAETPSAPLPRQVGLVSRHPREDLTSAPFHAARARGYRVALPRAAIPDPSSPTSPAVHSEFLLLAA
jgi:hypothetical protein